MHQPWEGQIVRDVVLLPLQLGRRATSLGLSVAGQVAGVGLRALGRVIAPSSRDAAQDEEEFGDARFAVENEEEFGDARFAVAVPTPETRPAHAPAPAPGPGPTPAPTAEAVPADTTEPELDVPPETAPAHVSEEPELVDSYAEPGAEDGPGASLHVEEPWKGYGHMAADDVIARLTAASREELAAVELYERLHRGRRTVLTAAGRQLRRASAPGRQAG